MRRRRCVGWIGALLAGTIGLVAPAADAAERDVTKQPNVVVILSDDYGWGSATCYGADPALVRTPNIDRLAAGGRRFTDGLTTSSVCSPTRYSLLTGRYCWRTSLKQEVLGTTSPLHIEPGRLNLASMLKAKGYRTAAIGKWHLGYGSAPKTDYTKELKPGPLEIGFDYHFAVPSNHGDGAGVYVENHGVLGLRSDKLTPRAEQTARNFRDQPFLGLDAPHRVDEEVMPTLTRKAVGWIEQQTPDTPFFLYYTPVAVHRPITPSEATRGTSQVGPYGDWIHELDGSVGAVLDALDRKGLADSTLVLFSSDNGGVNHPEQDDENARAIQAGLKVTGPYRGGKHDVWEGGFRVPYVVRWPGHVPAGTTCDETVSLVDTLASVAAIVGEPLPPASTAGEDSVDVSPAWLGTDHATPLRRDVIEHAADGTFALRRGDFKWIEGVYHPDTKPAAVRARKDQHRPQLYDLAADRGEATDVSGQHPEVVAEMRALLDRYRDGGYSRELPPPSPVRPAPPTLPPAADVPVKLGEWTTVRGDWQFGPDGTIVGTQAAGDQVGAAIRATLGRAAADIRYDLTLPSETSSHALRLQGPRPEVVVRVEISPTRVQLVRQAQQGESGTEVLASAALKLEPKAATPVRVHVAGDTVAARVGDVTVTGSHPSLAGEKPTFALLARGQGITFEDLTVTAPASSGK